MALIPYGGQPAHKKQQHFIQSSRVTQAPYHFFAQVRNNANSR